MTPRSGLPWVLLALLLGVGGGYLVGHANSTEPAPAKAGPAATKLSKPNDADIGFCQDMSVHHDQALQMATLAIGKSSDDRIKRMAVQILTSQSQEKGIMGGWLLLWHAPEGATDAPMMWMHHGSAHEGHMDEMTASNGAEMPGMATLDEMQEFAGLSGKAADVRFLQLMIRHHTGGLVMANAGHELARTPEVRGIAFSMGRDQSTENVTMRAVLKDLGGEELPYP